MLLGGISDLWQREIMGIGPTGRDKGKGGKFLLLPPDHDGAVPDGLHGRQIADLWRGVRRARLSVSRRDRDGGLADEDDAGLSAVAGRQPAGRRSSSTARSKEIDTIFADYRSVLRRSGLDDRARAARQRFRRTSASSSRPSASRRASRSRPTPRARRCFDEAARFAAAIARTNSFDSDDPARLVYPDRAWEWAFIGGSADLGLAGLRQHRPPRQLRLHRDRHVAGDGREARRHRFAVSVDAARRERRVPRRRQALSPAHPAEHPGEELLVGGRLRRRQPFDPAQRPAVPVGEHLHRTRPRMPTAPSTSTSGPNAPTAPAQRQELDPDNAGKGWFMLFRFYGPLEPFFDKTWKPDDIVEVTS